MAKTVFIVEDNDLNRRFFNDLLLSEGYRTITCASGDAAIGIASVARPDLILMDMRFSDVDGAVVDGVETTRRLKRDPATEAIPVVAVTGCAMAGDEDRFRDEGCDDYISKPVTIGRLLSCVEKHLQ